MRKFHIDLMVGLSAHLAKHAVDRIRYHLDGTNKRQAAAANLDNTVFEEIQELSSPFHHAVEDIFVGICNAEADGRKPLSVQRLFTVFQCMSIINTREVRLMMKVDDRQAQRYVRAAKFALPFLERKLKRSSLDPLI